MSHNPHNATLQAIYDKEHGDWDNASTEVVRQCQRDTDFLSYVVKEGARYLIRRVSHEQDTIIARAAVSASAANFDTASMERLANARIMDLMLSCNERLGDATKQMLKDEEALYTTQGHSALARAAFFEEVHKQVPSGKRVRQCLSEKVLVRLWAQLVTE